MNETSVGMAKRKSCPARAAAVEGSALVAAAGASSCGGDASVRAIEQQMVRCGAGRRLAAEIMMR